MELGRLAGRGRLSELFGALALPADRVMRTLGLDLAARAQVADLRPEIRQRLQAYADGVSAWLVSKSRRLPPELVLLGTGNRLTFPAIETYAELIKLGVGVEVMDTGAACRTYNILMSDGRKVAAGLMMI